MKIERDKSDLRNYTPSSKPVNHVMRKTGESPFDQEMNGRREAECQFRMQELLKEIDHLNERLNKNMTVNDLMLYKRLVKQFLQEAGARAYQIKQQRARNRRGRSILVSIQTVDREIETLVNDFIDKKKDPFELLIALDKIRGMLVDMVI
ncbi:MAG: YaaR family protein [Syntrophomonadaceae bacterium]|nr:YaaR family protein [Syntrophomonadaceae bacterium]